MMLARVADSLYWIGRYIERAEHVSRLSDVLLLTALDQTASARHAARIAMDAVGGDEPDLPYRTPREQVRDLVLDRRDGGSVLVSLARARENARQVRDHITTETWERLNLVYLRVTGPKAESAFLAAPSSYLHEIIADLHLFKGATDATMSHGEGWRFLLLGVYMERAQLISRLLDVCFGDAARGAPLDDHFAQLSVLKMACALEPYLRAYTSDMQPQYLLEFLLFDAEFPRSLRFCAARIEEHLKQISRHTDPDQGPGPDRLASRLNARLEFADPGEVQVGEASAFLAYVVGECARIHEQVYETFVAYTLERRLPV